MEARRKIRKIGLVCATPREYKATAETIPWENLETSQTGFRIKKSELEGKTLFLTVSGMGKAAAAAATQNMICQLDPDMVISFGTAGALDKRAKAGTVITPAKLIQGDMGVYDSLGFHHIGVSLQHDGKVIFAKKLYLSEKLANWCADILRGKGIPSSTGTLLTCDQIVLSPAKRDELHRQFGAVAVEMESSAVAQTAETNGIPCMVLKAISDEVDLEIAHLHEMMNYRDDPRSDSSFASLQDEESLNVLARFFQQLQLAYANMAQSLYLMISNFPEEIDSSFT